MQSGLRALHFYRKVSSDFTDATSTGGLISLVCLFFMVVLFLLELNAYMTVSHVTSITMDSEDNKEIDIHFNITMHRLPCQFASVEVEDVMNTRRHNVTYNIQKWRIDSRKIALNMAPSKAAALKSSTAGFDDDVVKMGAESADGGQSAQLTASSFNQFITSFDLVLVNFYAPW